MRTFFLSIALLLIALPASLLPTPAAAAEVVAVLSSNTALYQQTVAEIDRLLARRPGALLGPRSIAPPGLEVLNLADFTDPATLPPLIRARKPLLILALGGPALAAVAAIDDLPVLYLFAPNGPRLAASRANITGIDLTPAAADQLAAVKKLLPANRRVGLLTGAAADPAFLAEAHQAAASHSLTLVIGQIEEPRRISQALGSLAGRIDLFWLTPERELLQRQYLQAIMLFSLRERVPVFTFSELLLKEGATLAVSPDLTAIGAQAARLAEAIIKGESPRPQHPARVTVTVNHAVAEKLGLSLAVTTPSGEER